ncbi:hypothetical protein AAFN47_01955 [Hoeflea sp. CAU 1731]
MKDLWADGKQHAWQAIWQGAFILPPAVLLWWLDLAIPAQGQLALGAGVYLMLAGSAAYILRRRKTASEVLENKMQQALDRMDTKTDEGPLDIKAETQRVKNNYEELRKNFEWALSRQKLFLDYEAGKLDESPMGLGPSIDASITSMKKWWTSLSRVLTEVPEIAMVGHAPAIPDPEKIEPGDVVEIERLRDLAEARMDEFTNSLQKLGLS